MYQTTAIDALNGKALFQSAFQESTTNKSDRILNGEYSTVFHSKPLGLGLVPSSQLYGSWEVGEVVIPHDPVQVGDVIISVNGEEISNLTNSELATFLRSILCPITMTLRNPSLYRNVDSVSTATAMFPGMLSNRRKKIDTNFSSRASAEQWKMSLNRATERNKSDSKPHGRSLSSRSFKKENKETASPNTQLYHNSKGEFEFVFESKPLRLSLAPSTRLYGSAEISDARFYEPMLETGDVILAVNGNERARHWTMEEIVETIWELETPIHIMFRRPLIYSKYLRILFSSDKIRDSDSISHSMYPDTKEYRHENFIPFVSSSKHKTQQINAISSGKRIKKSESQVESMSVNDWKHAAANIDKNGRFTCFSGLNNVSSSVLTVEHVTFLRSHLPNSLQRNQLAMEYSTLIHGWSSLHFYSKLKNKGPSILAVKDTRGHIFGVFSSSSWKHSLRVYGNGRTFVFCLRPNMHVYPWSGLNSSFLTGKRDSITVGGGAGFALSINLDAENGFTQTCDTFLSPPLVQPKYTKSSPPSPPNQNDRRSESFYCWGLEVWRFAGVQV